MNLAPLNTDDSKQSSLFVTNSDGSTTKAYQMIENIFLVMTCIPLWILGLKVTWVVWILFEKGFANIKTEIQNFDAKYKVIIAISLIVH